MPKSVCESTFYAFIDKIYVLFWVGCMHFDAVIYSVFLTVVRDWFEKRENNVLVYFSWQAEDSFNLIFFFLDVVSVWWILLTVSLSFSLHLSAQFDMFEASDSVKAWTLKYSLSLSFSLIRFWEGRDVCTPVTRPVTTARAPPFLSLCSDGTRVWWWGHFLFLKHSHSWTHSLKITHTNTQTKRWFPECIPHFSSE